MKVIDVSRSAGSTARGKTDRIAPVCYGRKRKSGRGLAGRKGVNIFAVTVFKETTTIFKHRSMLCAVRFRRLGAVRLSVSQPSSVRSA